MCEYIQDKPVKTKSEFMENVSAVISSLSMDCKKCKEDKPVFCPKRKEAMAMIIQSILNELPDMENVDLDMILPKDGMTSKEIYHLGLMTGSLMRVKNFIKTLKG